MSLAALDRPVWSALTGRQAHLAVGDARAWRFDPAVSVFGEAADASPEAQAALAALIEPGGELWRVEREATPPPPGTALATSGPCYQMIAETITTGAARDRDIVELGDADAAEMLALATLTQPGPFRAGTYRFGGFLGVREDGRLTAMAGTRLRPGRFTELSGVCTHPDHRGRGHAGLLMRAVAARLLDRGETPFLTVWTSNTGAVALYESLGFRIHQVVTATVIAR